jgi:hypothetical protein
MIEMKQTDRMQNQCKLGNLFVNLWRFFFFIHTPHQTYVESTHPDKPC